MRGLSRRSKVVCGSSQLVLKYRDDVILGECEMSFVHHTLSKITDDLPSCAEDVIQSSYSLFKKYSPEKMAGAAEKYLRERSVFIKGELNAKTNLFLFQSFGIVD